MSDLRSPLYELAKAARLGDLAAVNDALNRMEDNWSRDIERGRLAADRLLRRDPPLPPVDHAELARSENWGSAYGDQAA